MNIETRKSVVVHDVAAFEEAIASAVAEPVEVSTDIEIRPIGTSVEDFLITTKLPDRVCLFAFGSAKVVLDAPAHVRAFDHTTVFACPGSRVDAEGDAFVSAHGANVTGSYWSKIRTSGGDIMVTGDAVVEAYADAVVRAYDRASVYLYGTDPVVECITAGTVFLKEHLGGKATEAQIRERLEVTLVSDGSPHVVVVQDQDEFATALAAAFVSDPNRQQVIAIRPTSMVGDFVVAMETGAALPAHVRLWAFGTAVVRLESPAALWAHDDTTIYANASSSKVYARGRARVFAGGDVEVCAGERARVFANGDNWIVVYGEASVETYGGRLIANTSGDIVVGDSTDMHTTRNGHIVLRDPEPTVYSNTEVNLTFSFEPKFADAVQAVATETHPGWVRKQYLFSNAKEN